ncbi:Bro-N domain-containing protein [Candidatus Woesearchaeota archaeon]|nr:Bro-N domain-containing protein [Candidatus Woesearchaeota archaeon]
METKSLITFQDKNIRRTWHNDLWWFVIEDVVLVLTDSKDPKQYIQRMKQRDEPLSQGWVQIVRTLPVETFGGIQQMNCANTEGIFRIIQSIPSPKAEPFKQWLAQVGYERVQEIENPELAQERMKLLYEQKGYSKDWIDKRLRGIAIRQELTDEWKQRGIDENKEFAILTNEIAKATFGKTVSEHKELKRLQKENLRDHMTDLELIFSMLGEKSTTEIAKVDNTQGLEENKDAARRGGTIAGGARVQLEKELKRKVVTSNNYLTEPERVKRKHLTQ